VSQAATRYKGVEYMLIQRNKDQWDWMFFPTLGDRLPRGGELSGTRDHAEMACMSAIAKWVALREAVELELD
jgi:hypothetical protein